MGDPQLPGDHAGPDPVMGHLHDFMTDVVGQRSAVDEHSSELVHPALAQRGGNWRAKAGGKTIPTIGREKVRRGESPAKWGTSLPAPSASLVVVEACKEGRNLSPIPWPPHLSWGRTFPVDRGEIKPARSPSRRCARVSLSI